MTFLLRSEPFIKQTLQSRGYRAAFSSARLARWEEQNHCPANDRLCEETVWLSQSVLLSKRSGMEQIAEAMRKIHTHATELAKA